MSKLDADTNLAKGTQRAAAGGQVNDVCVRPASKADASEVAVLVNIATHGLFADLWGRESSEPAAFNPVEVGRRKVLDEGELSWRHASLAEHDGETIGLVLGSPNLQRLPCSPPTPMPILRRRPAEAGTSARWRSTRTGAAAASLPACWRQLRRDDSKPVNDGYSLSSLTASPKRAGVREARLPRARQAADYPAVQRRRPGRQGLDLDDQGLEASAGTTAWSMV